MSNLLLSESPLVLLPSLAVALGSAEKAIICQQLYYLMQRSEQVVDGKKWITLTVEKSNRCKSWAEILPWVTGRSIKRYLEDLTSLGVIESKNLNQSTLDRTLSWSINTSKLEALGIGKTDNASCQNVTMGKNEETAEESRNSDNDKMDSSIVTKCHDINTESNKEDRINLNLDTKTNPPLPPHRGERMSEEDFLIFWEAYPKKQDKKKAYKSFSRLKKGLLPKILASIAEFKKTDSWQKGFIPMPTTFINGERWEDIISISIPKDGIQKISTSGEADEFIYNNL